MQKKAMISVPATKIYDSVIINPQQVCYVKFFMCEDDKGVTRHQLKIVFETKDLYLYDEQATFAYKAFFELN